MQFVIKRFKEENQIETKVRKGWPGKWTELEKSFSIQKFVKNAPLSARKVSEKLFTSISLETVRRVLRKVGLHGRSARKKILFVRKTKSLSCYHTK